MSSLLIARLFGIGVLSAVSMLAACTQAPGGVGSRDAAPVDEAKREELRALFDRCEATRRDMTRPGSMNPGTAQMIDAMDRCQKLLPDTRIQGVRFW